MTTPGQAPWRVGRSVGRMIYDADDRLIGVMDTPELAAYVVHAANLAAPRIYTQEGTGLATVTTWEYARPLPNHVAVPGRSLADDVRTHREETP